MRIWKRKAAVVVGTVAFETYVGDQGREGLDFSFKVVRTLTSGANTCELSIFNLNPRHRAAVAEQAKFPVRLTLGYEDLTGLVFSGNIRTAKSHEAGLDHVTDVAAGDGEQEARSARVNLSFPPDTTVAKVLEETARATGLGIGNVAEAAQGAALAGLGPSFAGGTVVSGNAWKHLQAIAKSAELEVSVQDGILQMLARGKALQRTAVLLSPGTGLKAAPTKDNTGIVKAVAFLNPDLLPGRQVEFRGTLIHVKDKPDISPKGQYRIDKVTMSGDTSGGDWNAEIECREL